MDIFVWILLAALYLTMLFVLGMTTLRNGHVVLFWVGIFFPVLWIVGALMAPAPGVASAETRADLHQR